MLSLSFPKMSIGCERAHVYTQIDKLKALIFNYGCDISSTNKTNEVEKNGVGASLREFSTGVNLNLLACMYN